MKTYHEICDYADYLWDTPDCNPLWHELSLDESYTKKLCFKDYPIYHIKSREDYTRAWFNQQRTYWVDDYDAKIREAGVKEYEYWVKLD